LQLCTPPPVVEPAPAGETLVVIVSVQDVAVKFAIAVQLPLAVVVKVEEVLWTTPLTVQFAKV
jgi:hypothetical protein